MFINQFFLSSSSLFNFLRSILLLSGLILNTLIVFSQNDHLPVGAKWHYTDWCFTTPNCAYYTLEITKDTVIQGMDARVMEYTSHTSDTSILIPGARQYFYTDSGKVYHFHDGQFFLFYDFSAETGDTITVNFGADSTQYLHYFTGFPFPGPNDYDMIVDSVSSVEADGATLKVQYVTLLLDPYGYNDTACWNISQSIIEGIGFTTEFFGSGCTPFIGFRGNFRCYQDTAIFYSGFFQYDCDYIFDPTNTTNLLSDEIGISVYPNPAKSSLQLQFLKAATAEVLEWILYDQFGRPLKVETIPAGSREHQISIADIPSGIYVYQVRNRNGVVFRSGKLVVVD